MDINKYLEQLQNDLNSQLENLSIQDIKNHINSGSDVISCPFCGEELSRNASFCPYCGNELNKEKFLEEENSSQSVHHSIYKLQRFEELEEETKSKIGTFERIYQQTYQIETGKGLVEKFGNAYCQLDFASLVNLLASAIEIELKESVLTYMRKEYGSDFSFRHNDIDIRLNKKFLSLRAYQICISYDIEHHKGIEKYDINLNHMLNCINILDKIIPIRNNADHTNYIDENTFFKFYDYVYMFFAEYMENLILLKKNAKKANCKFHSSQKFIDNENCDINDFSINNFLSSYSFSDDDKAYLASLEDDGEQLDSSSQRKKGVMFTNTRLLARKFFDNDIIKTKDGDIESKLLVKEHLKDYISNMSSYAEIDYTLIDVDDFDFYELKSWQDFAKILNSCVNKIKNNQNDTIGLFIIGGNDVIPMPQVLNPLNDNSESEKLLDADVLYAYYDDTIESLTFKNGSVDANTLLNRKPRYWIGRLPLENGLVDDIYDNFTNYFKRAFCEYVHAQYDENHSIKITHLGIEIHKHIATACESAELVTKRVLKGIPLQPQDQRIGFISDNIFVSPGLDLRVNSSRKEDYKQAVNEADMQTFILHGSAYPSMDCYYGETKDKQGHGYQAFYPDLFTKSKIKVVSGICCWGARYIGFTRMQSAVLKAIYSNVLLFMGSCRSACGTFDIHLEKYGCDIALAEILLKYYLNYLLQGYNAGEAIGRAKVLQLTHPDCEDINMVLGTILEFNLYGDPLLSLVPQLSKSPIEIIGNEESLLNDYSSSNVNSYRMVYNKEDEKNLSILDRLRSKVDRNLLEIRNKVNKQLYSDFKIESNSLETIHTYQTKSGIERYRFSYREDKGNYDNNTIVMTDNEGNVKRIWSTF